MCLGMTLTYLDKCMDINEWNKVSQMKVDRDCNLDTFSWIAKEALKSGAKNGQSDAGYPSYDCIFRAEESSMDIKGSVRVVNVPEVNKDPFLANLESEIKTISFLSSTKPLYFVKYFGCVKSNEDSTVVYLFFERMTSDLTKPSNLFTSSNVIQKPGRLESLLMMSKSLSYLHDQNMVHLNVKPSSFKKLKANNREIVKMVNFGSLLKENAPFNRGDLIYGDPSIEQKGYKVTRSSDIYSLALTLENLLRDSMLQGHFSTCDMESAQGREECRSLLLEKIKADHSTDKLNNKGLDQNQRSVLETLNEFIVTVLQRANGPVTSLADFESILSERSAELFPEYVFDQENEENLLREVYGIKLSSIQEMTVVNMGRELRPEDVKVPIEKLRFIKTKIISKQVDDEKQIANFKANSKLVAPKVPVDETKKTGPVLRKKVATTSNSVQNLRPKIQTDSNPMIQNFLPPSTKAPNQKIQQRVNLTQYEQQIKAPLTDRSERSGVPTLRKEFDELSMSTSQLVPRRKYEQNSQNMNTLLPQSNLIGQQRGPSDHNQVFTNLADRRMQYKLDKMRSRMSSGNDLFSYDIVRRPTSASTRDFGHQDLVPRATNIGAKNIKAAPKVYESTRDPQLFVIHETKSKPVVPIKNIKPQAIQPSAKTETFKTDEEIRKKIEEENKHALISRSDLDLEKIIKDEIKKNKARKMKFLADKSRRELKSMRDLKTKTAVGVQNLI